MKRLYLDNCSFNRPYDDQSVLKNHLEAEAKTYIQKEIFKKHYELAWSYIMDFEVSFNPFSHRKNQILKWKNIAIIDINESEKVIALANEIMRKNIRPKDTLHLACAIEAECDYFITTDEKILNKSIENIIVIDPIDFVKMIEVSE
jgi:predicted nucleic acid-binding protein